MWAKGPAFLRKSEDYWEFVPVDEVEHDEAKMEEKRKNAITMSGFSSTVPRIGNIIDWTKYSCLSKLLRITRYIVRFVRNLKTTVTKDRNFSTGELQVDELVYSENLWIRYEQLLIVECSNYPKLLNSLNLYEDENALIRSKTRISGVEEIDFKRRYPIL